MGTQGDSGDNWRNEGGELQDRVLKTTDGGPWLLAGGANTSIDHVYIDHIHIFIISHIIDHTS